jgi:hypothetical protein
MDCPRVRYPQFNDVVEGDLAEHGFKVLTDSSEQVSRDQGGGWRCMRGHVVLMWMHGTD